MALTWMNQWQAKARTLRPPSTMGGTRVDEELRIRRELPLAIQYPSLRPPHTLGRVVFFRAAILNTSMGHPMSP